MIVLSTTNSVNKELAAYSSKEKGYNTSTRSKEVRDRSRPTSTNHHPLSRTPQELPERQFDLLRRYSHIRERVSGVLYLMLRSIPLKSGIIELHKSLTVPHDTIEKLTHARCLQEERQRNLIIGCITQALSNDRVSEDDGFTLERTEQSLRLFSTFNRCPASTRNKVAFQFREEHSALPFGNDPLVSVE